MNLKDRFRDVETDCRNRLHDLAPPNRGGLNSTHIHRAHAPVEEPSTASKADVGSSQANWYSLHPAIFRRSLDLSVRGYAVNNCFYDELAESFHLIFDDWDATIVRQRDVLARLLPAPATGRRVLDCACGIGTQTIGLAMLGFSVEGSDLSDAAINRARREATARGLKVDFRVDDMRTLSTA